MNIYIVYKYIMRLSAPVLRFLLTRRLKAGKEDPARLHERMGAPQKPRPDGPLLWIHAASVGEAQSALILVEALLKTYQTAHILVTTGTRTSAALMETRLPDRAFHQYIPLDHPAWVRAFLNHWMPDVALWMESELWPNMLSEIKGRAIPAALVNARLSDTSFQRWQRAPRFIGEIISTFHTILTQTDQDQQRFEALGGRHVHTTSNLKYSAPPLPFNTQDLIKLQGTVGNRPLWVYASTHDGEESLAARLHTDLKEKCPGLLTIILPRHPERGAEIEDQLKIMGVKTTRRTEDKILPDETTDIYIADTLGETGLFFKLCPVAMIGRSFSHDGGGGHNLMEPCHFGCAVLTGPNVQFQQQMLQDMQDADAILQAQTEEDLAQSLQALLQDEEAWQNARDTSTNFARAQSDIIGSVMTHLKPVLSALPKSKREAA